MKWTDVTSSNIEALNLTGTVLSVRFKGGKVYAYQGVDQQRYDEIVNAPSVGKAFGALIKSQPERFPYTLVG